MSSDNSQILSNDNAVANGGSDAAMDNPVVAQEIVCPACFLWILIKIWFVVYDSEVATLLGLNVRCWEEGPDLSLAPTRVHLLGWRRSGSTCSSRARLACSRPDSSIPWICKYRRDTRVRLCFPLNSSHALLQHLLFNTQTIWSTSSWSQSVTRWRRAGLPFRWTSAARYSPQVNVTPCLTFTKPKNPQSSTSTRDIDEKHYQCGGVISKRHEGVS